MANAPGLRFSDGTTTVTISDGTTGILTKYEGKNKIASDPEVTEQCTFLALGGISTVRTTIEGLNKLFQQAKRYQEERIEARVFVERLTESAGEWWRSELVEALPVLAPSAMDSGIYTGKFEINLIFTRKNWWEGAEAQISLTNNYGTDNTSGLQIGIDKTKTGTTISFTSATKKISDSANGLAQFRTGDTIYVSGTSGGTNNGFFTIATGGVAAEIVVNETLTTQSAGSSVTITQAANYVEISSAKISGDLPAPTRIEMTATNPNTLSMVWLHQGWGGVLGKIPVMLGRFGSGSTGVAVATATEVDIITWTLTYNHLAGAAGQFLKAILGFYEHVTNLEDVWFWLELRWLLAGTLWSSPRVRCTTESFRYPLLLTPPLGTLYHEYQELTTLQLPPQLTLYNNNVPLTLALRAYQTTGSSITVKLDTINLLPLNGQRFCESYVYPASGSSTARIVDDGILGITYSDWGSGVNTMGNFRCTGNPIMLQPGVTQRIWFLALYEDVTLTSVDSVKLYYRPRKLTLN